MVEGSELSRHLFLQSRAHHPQGSWTEFARADLERSVPDRFEAMALRHPDRPAVAAKDGGLTYRELDESANRLAGAIVRQRGPAPEPVGVLARHGASAIVATFAALKAGKFFVPLDPHYPVDRLMYMLDDTDASLILTDREHHATAVNLARGRIPILVADECAAEVSAHRPTSPIAADALAGIYYTSGSTGLPKGIVYTHRYLLHNMMTYGDAFHVCPEDRWTWLHSYSFAAASTDIFCPLLHGAAVCPWDVQQEGLAGLGSWVEDAAVTIFHWIATPFRGALRPLEPMRHASRARLAVFGSESLFTSDVHDIVSFFGPQCTLVNRLGTSEIGLFRVYFFDRNTVLGDGLVPAGYGVPEKATVILDAKGTATAPGEIGEIAVRSRHFPPGYWRLPDLTREKFRDDDGDDGTRVFMSGDLGRMRPDGCLEHCGRTDSQVKIRGHRVEIKEVESALRIAPGVAEAIVKAWAKPSGEQYLAAYLVPAARTPLDDAMIRRHALRTLPGYMVPAAFVTLDALPRNSNQKVDVGALQPPDLAPDLPTEGYAPPQTRLEHHLVDLWQSILNLRPIGIDDDFFDLGGSSLQAMQIAVELQPLVDAVLPVSTLFENPTVASYAAFLESNHGRNSKGAAS